MDIPIADVMIHIDETLSKEALAKIGEAVHRNECVVSTCVPTGKMHLMLVAYNPQCISAKDILVKVKKEGVHAELVGM